MVVGCLFNRYFCEATPPQRFVRKVVCGVFCRAKRIQIVAGKDGPEIRQRVPKFHWKILFNSSLWPLSHSPLSAAATQICAVSHLVSHLSRPWLPTLWFWSHSSYRAVAVTTSELRLATSRNSLFKLASERERELDPYLICYNTSALECFCQAKFPLRYRLHVTCMAFQYCVAVLDRAAASAQCGVPWAYPVAQDPTGSVNVAFLPITMQGQT